MNQPPPYGYGGGGYAPQQPQQQQQQQPQYAPQQQQQQQQYANPYAAPQPPAMYRQNVFAPYGATSAPLVNPSIKKWKLILGIGQVVTLIVGLTMIIVGAALQNDAGGVLAIIGSALFMVWYMLIFAAAILNGFWIYKFWSWIPPDQRWTNMWKKYISPGMAIGYMFIPYFNIYWMFVVYLGLADVMDRMRVQYPCTRGSPKTTAILAIVIPMVFFPAAPFLQYYLAKHLEEMATEMQMRMGGNPMMPQAA